MALYEDFIKIGEEISWKYSQITILQKPTQEGAAILTSIISPDARLHIADTEFFLEIKKKIPKSSIFQVAKKEIRQNIWPFATALSLLALIIFLGIFLIKKIDQDSSISESSIISRALISVMVTKENHCQNPESFEEWKNFQNQVFGSQKYNIYVIRKDEFNAISLPGNNIIIFSGLLNKITNANQLTFVIGHEVGHIEHKDHRRLYLLNNILYSGSESSLNFLITLIETYYSREAEVSADIFALGLMNKNKINPEEALRFLQILQKQDAYGEKLDKILSYVSSHPATTQRIEVMNKEILKGKGNFESVILSESWKKLKNICN